MKTRNVKIRQQPNQRAIKKQQPKATNEFLEFSLRICEFALPCICSILLCKCLLYVREVCVLVGLS